MNQTIIIEGAKATYKYKQEQDIGQGSFGIVYKGEVVDVKSQQESYLMLKRGQFVAIKRLRKSLSNLKNQDKKIEYNRQKKIFAQLSKAVSAYVIQQFQSFQLGDRYYMVMEYSEDGSLEKLIQRHKKLNLPIPQEKIYKFLLSIVNGIHFMHNKVYKGQEQQEYKNTGIMHRDLKPANILIFDNESHCKLIDFGFAKRTKFVNQKKVHTFCGTAPYESPQMLGRKSYCAKADVWSIGIILWEMLTLARPFAPRSSKNQIILTQKKLFQKRYFQNDGQAEFIKEINNKLKDTREHTQIWIQILRNTLAYQQNDRLSSKQLIEMLTSKLVCSRFKKNRITSEITQQLSKNQRQCISNYQSPQSRIRREEARKMIKGIFEQKSFPLDTRQQLTKLILRTLCLYQYLDQHSRNIQTEEKIFYSNTINKAREQILRIQVQNTDIQLGNRFWQNLQCVIPNFNFKSVEYNPNKLRQAIYQTLDHFQIEVAEEKQLADLFIILKFQISVTNQRLEQYEDQQKQIEQIRSQLIKNHGYQKLPESQFFDQSF